MISVVRLRWANCSLVRLNHAARRDPTLTFHAEPPRALRSDGLDFQPVAYALDLILPILDLGQERAFTPVGPTRWVAWAAVPAGWLLATTVIAGITRRMNRT
ncbi:hypothetical protein [Cryptosporangium arvum]|uniref:hypothetical protein n=1 Tax=Cryptosporangium arvum TaxID=80871 RepID=UPI0012ED809C|nr:hypothetical protein [Cryptosporangium arvum]